MAAPSPARPPAPVPGAAAAGGLRRSTARTLVVWEALHAALDIGSGHGLRAPLQVLDVGGGTGGLAVRVAEHGHRVVVVDPSPDALATLARRCEEAGVADRVTAVQGEVATLPDLLAGAGPGAGPEGQQFDLVLCHGVLEVVEDPMAALGTLASMLRPSGRLSLLVSQRHAAVVARAMAGHLPQARALLDGAVVGDRRRFTAEETTSLLTGAGFTEVVLHAVRVFSDLVPEPLVDLEPGAAAALLDLERAVANRPEYLTLATQLHALAVRS